MAQISDVAKVNISIRDPDESQTDRVIADARIVLCQVYRFRSEQANFRLGRYEENPRRGWWKDTPTTVPHDLGSITIETTLGHRNDWAKGTFVSPLR